MSLALAAEASDVESLIDLVRHLSQACNSADIIAKAVHAVRRLTGAEGATFAVKEGESCHYVDEDAVAPLWRGQHFPVKTCVSGWVITHGKTAVVADILQDARVPDALYAPTFVRSLVAAPVNTASTRASIGAYWARTRRPSDDEVATVETIAHATALALQNMELTSSLRAAAATKSRLLTAVGHDLRQPLQSLALFASVLEGEANTEIARQAASQLNASVDRMANLLGAIMALADLDSRTVAVSKRPVTVDALFEPLEEEMAPQARAKGIELRRIPSNATVMTDPGLMTAVLRNLVANAIRYTHRGGVLLGARRRGDEVHLMVADTGIGIDPAQQASIFEEFYQVGNSARDFTAGTGVGLAMVRRLVDILGHRIRLHSVEGRGSQFVVVLPAA
jgi:two-component system CheB/CheR fusion protein